jgi:cytochrome c oxidase assembly protein subunit 15
MANFAAMFFIIASGAAVRLTGSGLGCADWPNCQRGQLTASLGQWHSVVEDANRMITVALVILTVATVVAAMARTPRRGDLVWLSGALVAGVIADALLGAEVVYSKLNPWLVSSHMALSIAMLLAAGVLHHRSKYRYGAADRAEVRCAWTVPLARWLWLPLSLTLLAGMGTTGAGPHAGASQGQLVARRLPWALIDAAWLHSVCAVAFLGIVAGAYLVLARTGAASRVVGGAQRLLVIGTAQGLIGVTQYLTHLPVLLVELHVIGAASVAVGVLHFQFAQVARDREPGLERAVVATPVAPTLVAP